MQKNSRIKTRQWLGWLTAFSLPCLFVGGLAGWLFYSEAVNDIGRVYSAWGQTADWPSIRAGILFCFLIFGLLSGILGVGAYGIFRWIRRNREINYSSEPS